MNKVNHINSNESKTQPSKFSKFVENTRTAINKAIATTSIVASSIYPASINTISTTAPLTTSPITTTITVGTASSLLAACTENLGPETVRDTIPPTIDILKNEIDITGGKEIQIIGTNLYIGGTIVASRTDNISKEFKVDIIINGGGFKSGEIISDEGILTLRVRDQSGNIKTAEIKLNITKDAPHITVNKREVNIFGGATININNNQLLIGDEVIASRTDDNLKSCQVSMQFNGQEISSGYTVNEAGKLTLSITNKNGKTSTIEISLTDDTVYGLENLKNSSLQVDQEIDLVKGISFADGINLIKTEIQIDGHKTTIEDPHHYTPEYPGECSIIFTIKGKNNTTSEITIDQLTIKPLEYKAIPITNLKPVDILPIIGQVEKGWGDGYSPIEHLRVAESTRMRDMMWKYGAGNHTPEQYQQLMARLHTGMLNEFPYDYENYEKIGTWWEGRHPSKHAYEERHILNTLINHANFQISNSDNEALGEVVKSHPNNIYIIGNSSYTAYPPTFYNEVNKEGYSQDGKDAWDQPNFIMRIAGSNIKTEQGELKNKICHRNISPTQTGIMYGLPSRANSKQNEHPNRHLMITIGTNSEGNVDQTDETGPASRFPVGFNDNVLFSGHTFPYRDYQSGYIVSEGHKYATSYTNYLNLAMTDLCFQMFAEVEDVNQLLTMIRSTSLTDYISLDGQTQSLHLINPAGFIQKYLMPTDLPTSVKFGEITPLNKGYYKGIIFDIPGAEVNIDGEWMAYNDTNKNLIKSQNPITLEWRLNGNLCKKLGYSTSNPIQGKTIICDDKWNGLNIQNNISVIPKQ